jgi:hypothetical protein
MYWALNIKAIMITNTKIRELVTAPALGSVLRDGILNPGGARARSSDLQLFRGLDASTARQATLQSTRPISALLLPAATELNR